MRQATRWTAVCCVAGAVLLLGITNLDVPPKAPQLPAPPVSAGLPASAARIALGRLLFFDPILSGDRTIACATCHDPAHGFADPRGFSRGINGKRLPRNTPSVANLAWSRALFHDGRAGSLEEQALEPLLADDEMGADPSEVLARLSAIDDYRAMFAQAFPGKGISLTNLARALAAYERTLVTRDTHYDRWAGGDATALSPSAQRGWTVFNGKARCAECHPAPLFGSDDLDPIGTPDRSADGTMVAGKDPGLARITNDRNDFGAFRAPSLRNLEHTAPYMHNGVFGTLAEVVEFYDEGGGRGLGLDVFNQDEDIVPLQLTEQEEADLIAFLRALSQRDPIDRAPERVPSGLVPGGVRKE
jgi:cytochrome c peroxidase